MPAKIWRIVTVALASFQQEGAARGAAGTAYYTLFSFFPLLIVLVTIGSFFVSIGRRFHRKKWKPLM